MNTDLQAHIEAWRAELLRHPGLEPGLVEELESHLRDSVAAAIDEGADPERALEDAKRRLLDDLDLLARDIHRSKRISRRRPAWDRGGILFLLPNILRSSYRSVARRRGYAALNLVGLAVAITSAFLIFAFILDQASYDRFHPAPSTLYRLSSTSRTADGEMKVSRVPAPLGPLLDDVAPEVLSSVRFLDLGKFLVNHEDQALYVENTLFVDSTFFEMFGFELTVGNSARSLRDPTTAIVSQSTARRFFGDRDPIGKLLTMEMGGNEMAFQIGGIVADAPTRSHIRYDLLLPFSYWDSLPDARRQAVGFDSFVMTWENDRVGTYLRLAESTDPLQAADRIRALVADLVSERVVEGVTYTLEPIEDVYLRSEFQNALGGPEGDIRYLYLLAAIGIIILVIASVNFVNLATAHASERSLETGIRKVLGARPGDLTARYLGESLVVAGAAGIVSIAAAAFLLPTFELIIGNEVTVLREGRWLVWLMPAVVGIAVGIIAGIYPALVLAAFSPRESLKSTGGTTSGRSSVLRRVLVVTQFAAACVLFAGTLVVKDQLAYFQEKKLGYSKDQVLLLSVDASQLGPRFETLEERLRSVSGVRSASIMSFAPGQTVAADGPVYPFRTAGMSADEDPMMWDLMPVDHRFLETMEIELVEGRFFSLAFPGDSTGAFVINQTAARTFGDGGAVGELIDWYFPGPGGTQEVRPGRVVGVVEDFHAYSLHAPIRPTVMVLPIFHWFRSTAALKLSASDIAATLDELEGAWNEVAPDLPFERTFLDEEYEALYQAEVATGRVFGIMAALAFFVACLGLVGMASFVTHQRTKEIGIRKVLGASRRDILSRLMFSFLGLVGTGVLLAVPIVWIGMDRWLDRFAYRVDLDPMTFAVVGVVSLAVAAAVISVHTVRVTRVDPARCLRAE